eukprot:Blabericola_migrator_1__8143@NODE_41_length_17267_cov_152_291279_g37_i0_p5_GENE_NODE_41_length_17267_cov_152_291279_g37_i0NODE_41_length_17267_cov_152_291279_g37_i0_p5_ORF_typecomplete_len304_score51_98zfNOSIP/PF15906_5/5_2e29zfNOSIP/PF15906_5/7_7e03Rtf2/PF04641_12/1_7e02Rtf2/PF04641_12/8e02Rtf2/PF04641_12/2_1e06zfC3HC4_4/PF15227_6/7e06zfC3HC4_4/PF15227_6/8_1e03zfC3HC4_2/PF13923_6/3_6e05zfC3HC4_2/PF13923_6/9_1e03zfRING_UBOX/PF13445_6/0_00048zfRING_UBOX/PF13445_6/2_8e03zfC3HC4/PF00097_25/0_0011Ub
MSRHSKNNTASSVFTYHERKSIKGYGSIHERLGTESLRQFEQCWICLKIAEEPVATPEGYLFCRDCIIFNFGKQREHWTALKEKERQAEELRKGQDNSNSDDVEAFIKGQDLFHKEARVRIKGNVESEFGYFENSDEERETVAMAERFKLQQARKRKKLVANEGESSNPSSVSFWAPHETHTGRANLELLGDGHKKHKKTEDRLVLKCPISNKPLRLKDLVTVHPKVEERDDGKTKWICSVSLKELGMQPVVLDRKTGELMLKEVLKEMGMKAPPSLIEMKTGESIFASHNKVEINVFRPNIA